MGLFGKADKFCIHSQAFQRDKDLLALFNRTAHVVLAVDDQRWSFGVADGLERRLVQVVVRVDPRRLVAERLFAYPVHVAGAVVAEPIDDAPQGHRGLESVGVPDDPID